MTRILIYCGLMTASSLAAEKPVNILFILADDLGITDIGAYARHFTGKHADELFYETPHMDRLIGDGLAFSQFYANQLCSPTRASIMTGQYAARHGFTTATPLLPTYHNQGSETPDGFFPHDVLGHRDRINQQQAWTNGRTNTALDPSLPTLPKVLKTHRSAFIGKWHLGGHGADGFQPLDQGFDEVPAWFDSGGSVYFDWAKQWDRKKLPYPKMPQKVWKVGDAGPAPHADYLTDDLTDRALRFIHEAVEVRRTGEDERPFFLYLNHFAVHTPLQAPKASVAHFESKSQKGTLGHDNATYAAMVKRLDDSVGRIMKVLDETGSSDNTLLILTSDNGGVEYTKPAATDNFPFKGGKACLHEGGVRVPLVFRMPGSIKGGKWCDTPTNCIDLLPTLADLTGNQVPAKVDGISLRPLLENPEAETSPRTFYWHYPFNVIVLHPDDKMPLTPHSGIREGRFKLLWDWHGRVVLYDIEKDPYESKDLSVSMPEKRDVLMQQLQDWIKNNVESRYLPILNKGYEPSKDKRDYPFVDLSGPARNREP